MGLAQTARRWTEGYQGENLPLGGYTALMGAYTVLFGGASLALRRRRRRIRVPSVQDTLLMGLATHKLARIVTRDWVTSPVRAPFTRYLASAKGGELEETSRGTGLRRAVGDLLTCPFCIGPWIAGTLVGTFAVSPKFARILSAVFAAVTLSDFLHRSYSSLGDTQKVLHERAQRYEAAVEALQH